jgi:hypothetical protein
MGKLISLADFYPPSQTQLPAKYNPQWYFADVYRPYGEDFYRFPWPNTAFPNMVAIHADEFKETDLRLHVRRWVELNLRETVIIEIIDKSYRKYYDEAEKDWDHSYEIKNNWYTFSFEDEHSATMFALRFADVVRPVTAKHPKRDD